MLLYFYFFFLNDTPTTKIYPLSLHDALPIYDALQVLGPDPRQELLEPEHRLEGPRARLSAGRHHQPESHEDDGHEHPGDHEGDWRQQERTRQTASQQRDRHADHESDHGPALPHAIGPGVVVTALEQPVEDLCLDGRQPAIELVFQLGHHHQLPMARKHAFEYATFVRRELRRARRRRTPLQRVIPAGEPGQELGFFVLLDLHVPAHRQIHERRGDVAQVGRVVDQRPGFRGRQPCWRLVLHADRTPPRVPPPV